MLKQTTPWLIVMVIVGACSEKKAGEQAPAAAVTSNAADFGNANAENLTISDPALGAASNDLGNASGLGAAYSSSPTDNDIVPSPSPPPEPERPKPK